MKKMTRHLCSLHKFNQLFARIDRGNYGRKHGVEPVQQRLFARISNPNPEYDRAGWLHAFPYGEVFVLGDDHGCFAQSMFPDATVIGVIQADIIDVLGSMALSDKPARKGRGREATGRR
jgi:hypothetical protein